jgi:DNA invertase Pin-like site-specific DNA recombinase
MTAQKVPASFESDTPRLAFSYQRVSDPKQTRDGRAGLDRQADAFNNFCQRHGLIPNADPVVDRGLSAFHGRHRSKGALGAFITAAEGGQVPLGSVLVVEDLDRFSRETASHAEELLLALFKQELALGIVRDDVVVDRARYDADLGLRVMLLTRRDAAHDYSRKLSGRISDVWQRRQRDWIEHRKPYLGKGSRPEWLSDDGSRFVEIGRAVDLVQRMFKLCAEENMGGTQIAEKLNAEGFKPAKSDAYGPTRILRILHDRRVLGEKQWPDGSISPDYFPRIVDQSLWDACQKAIDQRHDNKGRHGRGEKINNLFQGGTYCACGRALHYQPSRNRKGEIAYEWLRCSGKRKHICPQPPGDWKYDEEALLLAFMAQRWTKFFDRPSDNRQRRALEQQIRELETLAATQQEQASAAEANMSRLLKQDELDADVAAMLGKAVKDVNSAVKTTQKRIQELQTEIQQINRRPSGQHMQKQIQERVQAFMASDRHDVAERRRFNNWFLSLEVRVTVVNPKHSRLQWGSTDAVIYRDKARMVVSDETLGDMAAFGFSKADMAKREAEIKAERRGPQLTP